MTEWKVKIQNGVSCPDKQQTNQRIAREVSRPVAIGVAGQLVKLSHKFNFCLHPRETCDSLDVSTIQDDMMISKSEAQSRRFLDVVRHQGGSSCSPDKAFYSELFLLERNNEI